MLVCVCVCVFLFGIETALTDIARWHKRNVFSPCCGDPLMRAPRKVVCLCVCVCVCVCLFFFAEGIDRARWRTSQNSFAASEKRVAFGKRLSPPGRPLGRSSVYRVVGVPCEK